MIFLLYKQNMFAIYLHKTFWQLLRFLNKMYVSAYVISDLNKVLHKYRVWNCTQNKMEKIAVSLHLFNVLLIRTSQAGIYYKGNIFWFGRIKGKVLSSGVFLLLLFLSKSPFKLGKIHALSPQSTMWYRQLLQAGYGVQSSLSWPADCSTVREKLTNRKRGTCGSLETHCSIKHTVNYRLLHISTWHKKNRRFKREYTL